MCRLWMTCVVSLCAVSWSMAEDPIAISDRLEPLVDTYLIESFSGDAKQILHRPKPSEVVLTTGEPWEGNTSAYYTVFRDGPVFRMYYRGSHANEKMQATHREVTCYAQSLDGIHWTKPALGLFEFNGSKKNNIVWDGIGTHCFVVFKDNNPDCPVEAIYKAIARGRPKGKKGLYIFQSPDGIHWKQMSEEPVITNGAFDSQNLAFWDPHAELYRGYHRTFINGVRAIMTETSKDFRSWTEPVHLTYPAGTPNEHLYTNAVRNYPGADHILLGFPTRFLPNEGSRVEPILMTSRDGIQFHRFSDPVIPESAPEDRDGNRSNYMAWGVVDIPGRPNEVSVYATEAYYAGPDSRVRRFVYRKDGFVSVTAKDGAMTTRTLTFSGKHLVLNYKVHNPTGSVVVQIEDATGQPVPGFSSDDCQALKGDQIAGRVVWKGGDLKNLIGKPLKLRMALHQAEVYSLRFE